MAPKDEEYAAFQKSVADVIAKVPECRITTLDVIADYLNTCPTQVERVVDGIPDGSDLPVHRVLRATKGPDDSVAVFPLKAAHRDLLAKEYLSFPAPDRPALVADWWIWKDIEGKEEPIMVVVVPAEPIAKA